MTTNRTYRTREQWQSIVDDFATSGLSAPKFCDQREVPYGSFIKWRHKLMSPSKPSKSDVAFLDLSAMPGTQSHSAWNITLKLGNGVELVLSQA